MIKKIIEFIKNLFIRGEIKMTREYPVTKKKYAPILTWNKNYLMSDEEFEDSGAMRMSEIQDFFEAKESCLSKIIAVRDFEKVPLYTYIWEECAKVRLNPRVIISLLQREQGLISKKTATPKQLKRALGVGCLDGGKDLNGFYGIENQVSGACSVLKRWFNYGINDIGIDENFKFQMPVSDGVVIPINAATFSFYKYCPHVGDQDSGKNKSPFGNYLFWLIYKRYWWK